MDQLGGKVVFEQKDHMGIVQVIEDNHMRSLHFGSLTKQSSVNVKEPDLLILKYMRVMMASLLFRPEPKKVLLLGMGGGSMAKLLWTHFPHCTIDAVESRPAVVEAGYEYFFLPKDERLHVHTQDAMEFLNSAKQSEYDLIIIDLFDSEGMPSLVADPQFFVRVDDLLRAGGMFVWNTWSRTAPDMMRSAIRHLCGRFYNNLLILPTREETKYVVKDGVKSKTVQDAGNNIFMVFKVPLPQVSKGMLDENAEKLKGRTKIDFPALLSEFHYFKGCGGELFGL